MSDRRRFKQRMASLCFLPSDRSTGSRPCRGIVADLGDGHDVEAEVELAIASAGKPVAHHLAGGHLGGGGAGVAGERGGRAEATNITDVAEDLAGGQRAETMQLGQGGAGCADGHLDIIGGLGDPAIELAHLLTRSIARGSVLAAASRGRTPRKSSAA